LAGGPVPFRLNYSIEGENFFGSTGFESDFPAFWEKAIKYGSDWEPPLIFPFSSSITKTAGRSMLQTPDPDSLKKPRKK